MSADDKTKVYGSADPALTVTVPNGALETGDSLSGSLERAAGQNVGAYAITKGSLTAGGNYDLTVTPGTLTITKKAITVTADDKTKVDRGCRPGADLQGHEWLARVRRQLQRSSHPCGRRGGWHVRDHPGHTDRRSELRRSRSTARPSRSSTAGTGSCSRSTTLRTRRACSRANSSLARRSRPSSCSRTPPVPSFGRRPTRRSRRSGNLGACDATATADTDRRRSLRTPESTYAWDGSQYHYNWSTKGLTGGEYRIYANLADGTKQYVDICLAK